MDKNKLAQSDKTNLLCVKKTNDKNTQDMETL